MTRLAGDDVRGVGSLSAISSERDNVHWFVPQGGRAATFDMVISDLDAGAPSFEIRALDPLGGRRPPDGSIVSPFIDFADATEKYTHRL